MSRPRSLGFQPGARTLGTNGPKLRFFISLDSKLKLRTELLRITQCLDDAGIEYALCGGLAVAAHGYPRLTKDIDLLIEENSVDSSHKALAKIEYDLDSGMIPFDIGTVNERRLSRVSKAEGRELLTLDLLVVTPAYREIWMTRESVEVDSKPIKVVSKDGLIKMQRIASRLQDLADIEALERIQ